MKILYLITKSEIGGAQTHVLQLVEYFSGQGHTVAVMAYPGGPLEARVRAAGAKFYPNNFFSNSYNPFRIIRAMRVIQKTVEEFSPDLVHCHSSAASVVGRLVLRGKVPTIYTAHGWAFTERAPFLRRHIAQIVERLVSRYTAKTICVSKADYELSLRNGVGNEKNTVIVYNGISTRGDFFVRKERDMVTVLFVGRLAYPKEPLLLIEAFAALLEDSKKKAELVFIGEGTLRTDAEKLVITHQLEQYVIFRGSVEPAVVIDAMRHADIFVLLSRHEGFPMTILEAMSVGLPVVASNVGGIPEQVSAASGVLVENNPDSVAKALLVLIKNKSLRLALGDAARARIVEEFSLEIFLQKTEAVYKEVLMQQKTS
ncbi:MAG TPA: glycosyltransferase family 4 protein [Candidatus Paceibacterota bacterium]|nr:glycosyltransferase family 4 protein [Candidatus Paceibacterota bacterium]